MFYRMLDEMPEFEMSRIYVENGDNGFINTLATKSMFKTKQDLYDILEFDDINNRRQFKEYEYLSYVCRPQDH